MLLISMSILRWWVLRVQYKITLLPEYMLGRFFQLTSLSIYLSKLATIDEQQFNNIYTHLIEDGFVYLTIDELQQLAELLLEILAIKFKVSERTLCEIYKKGVERQPQAYMAGAKDLEIFKSLQLTSFDPVKRCNVNLKGAKKDVYYNYIITTISFIETVLDGKVNVVEISDVPMLLKALFYSYIRGSEKREGKVRIDNISVALATSGAIISFIGRLKIGENLYEHFIVPDGSLASISNSVLFYNLVFRNTYDELLKLIQSFTNLEGVSLAKAFLMAVASQVTKIRDRDLDELLRNNVLERYLGIRISVSKRPDVLWMAPLTVTNLVNTGIKQEIIDVLSSLINITQRESKVAKDENLKSLASVVSLCVNNLTEYYFTNNQDALIECSRNAVAVSRSSEIDEKIKYLLNRLITKVRDLVR